MLVLTRKQGQSIMIGDKIEITVLDIKGEQIRIGITAPKDVNILRNEVYHEVREANKVSVANKNPNLEEIGEIIRKTVQD